MSTQTNTDTTETSSPLPEYLFGLREETRPRRRLLPHRHPGLVLAAKPRTRGDDETTRWIHLAHTSLNQAKMAAPRTASAASSSSVPNRR